MKLRGRHCQCGACHRYFNSLTAFETHRIGRFEPDERRCMTNDELRAKGLRPNAAGWWAGAPREAPIVDSEHPSEG